MKVIYSRLTFLVDILNSVLNDYFKVIHKLQYYLAGSIQCNIYKYLIEKELN